MKNRIIYVDLDNTLADFYRATKNPVTLDVDEHKMWDASFFMNLRPIPGSQGAVFELEKMGYDVWVLTQPLAENIDSYTDKARWVHTHFPSLYKKIVMTQNKGLNIGDYLIDDNLEKWKEKFENNGGKFVHYPYDRATYRNITDDQLLDAWRRTVEFFKSELNS